MPYLATSYGMMAVLAGAIVVIGAIVLLDAWCIIHDLFEEHYIGHQLMMRFEELTEKTHRNHYSQCLRFWASLYLGVVLNHMAEVRFCLKWVRDRVTVGMFVVVNIIRRSQTDGK